MIALFVRLSCIQRFILRLKQASKIETDVPASAEPFINPDLDE
jgi:hypothetical protein